MAKRPLNSAIVIAKLLDCEGFSDYTANQVERYWKRNEVKTDRQKRQVERLEQAFSEWTKDMPADKRLLLGKFIAMHQKMGFDTGVRIGLTCSAVRNAQEILA